MGKRRRKDKAHDVGDSKPGTVGDSQGTIHDRRGGPSFDPEDVDVPGESSKQTNHQHEGNQNSTSDEDNKSSTTESETEESEEEGTRMKYAKKYGESWPVDRQRRFLREHDLSAKDMGWKLTE